MYRLFYSIWKDWNTRDIVVAGKGMLWAINLKLDRNLRLIEKILFLLVASSKQVCTASYLILSLIVEMPLAT